MQRLLSKLVPFITFGIAIIAFTFGLIILAYLFLFGTVLGLILFAIAWIRQKFFSPKTPPTTKNSGRIIEPDDWKVL